MNDLRIRKRSLYATNYDRTVYARIDITVGVRERRLTRDEQSELTEALASGAMPLLAGARYLHTPLSKVKVTR